MIVTADSRRLPFTDGTFDLVFCAPPWDNVDVVLEARPELTRVLSKRGQMVLILPHLDDPTLATMAVANRDWSKRSQLAVPKPTEDHGWRYRSMSERFVASVLVRAGARRVLDPFCGSGTVVRVAQRLGLMAAGCDLSPVACRLAAA